MLLLCQNALANSTPGLLPLKGGNSERPADLSTIRPGFRKFSRNIQKVFREQVRDNQMSSFEFLSFGKFDNDDWCTLSTIFAYLAQIQY